MLCAVSTRAAAGAGAMKACAAAIKHTSSRAIDCIIILQSAREVKQTYENRLVFLYTLVLHPYA
jgi:hypothetical protein